MKDKPNLDMELVEKKKIWKCKERWLNIYEWNIYYQNIN